MCVGGGNSIRTEDMESAKAYTSGVIVRKKSPV